MICCWPNQVSSGKARRGRWEGEVEGKPSINDGTKMAKIIADDFDECT